MHFLPLAAKRSPKVGGASRQAASKHFTIHPWRQTFRPANLFCRQFKGLPVNHLNSTRSGCTMDRRKFNRLAAAALGGIVAGASISRAADKDEKKDKDKDEPKAKDPKKPALLQEPHVCRGLNTCKGKGKGKKNECAGQGDCSTAKAHTCGGDNDCRGLGGCKDDPGENACKGKGNCHVPLNDEAWAKARKRFEAEAKKAEMKIGDAPKKAAKDK
jgi:hypothetical protein